MRLIDADSFKSFLQALVKAGAPYEDVISLLDREKTAYNVNDVIKRLEGEEFLTTNDDGETDNLSISVMEAEKVYEIVHSGFVNC